MIQVHVDVDNLWIYEQEYGLRLGKKRDYVYTHCLPTFLDVLKETRSKATFMVIGRDLRLPACRRFCRRATREGHEIANHSWSHPTLLHALTSAQKRQEIVKAHRELTQVCGRAPVGFRGPGYYLNAEMRQVLQELGYRYDTSILPGWAPLIMMTYARLRGGENKAKAYGRREDIWGSAQPYDWTGGLRKLRELPISVLPWLRMPIHTTFAYTFGNVYQQLIHRYLRSKPNYVVYLFHAIDFADFGEAQPNHPVIPLRFSFDQRLHFARQIVQELVTANHGPLRTTRELLQPTTSRRSRRSPRRLRTTPHRLRGT